MANILVADDSSAIRSMIAFILKQKGHQVILAEDGRKALELVQGFHPDLILTDINMPFMNGFELASELRKTDHCKHTPIVALTTESLPELKQKGKLAGISGWMVKPINPAKLSSLVKNLIE